MTATDSAFSELQIEAAVCVRQLIAGFAALAGVLESAEPLPDFLPSVAALVIATAELDRGLREMTASRPVAGRHLRLVLAASAEGVK